MAEEPQHEGLTHSVPKLGGSMQNDEKQLQYQQVVNVRNLGSSIQRQHLLEAIRQVAVAHERSAQAMRDCAEAEARVSQLYRALATQ